MRNDLGSPFGTHRANGGMPQPAPRLDADPDIWRNEMRLDVELLNLDSTSLAQIAEVNDGDLEKMAAHILEIVRERGKMHNPVTNSGGVVVGRIAEIGLDFPASDARIGDQVSAICSLSLIPLRLDAIHGIDTATAQVACSGSAILFETATFGILPPDMPQRMAVGIIDVCGAPARILRDVRAGETVAVLGAGKAGLLSAYAARERVGANGRVFILDVDEMACSAARAMGVADAVLCVDLQDPVATHKAMLGVAGAGLADYAIAVTNARNTECGAILSVRQHGRIVLFSMATSFQAAALSAEGAGRDVDLLVGNGMVTGCIEDGLALVRRHPELWAELERRYA